MARKVVEISESERLNREQLLQRIGLTIKRLRTEAGMTQRELAAAAGMSHVHFALVEAGGPAISVVFLYNVAQVLGVPISVFFEDEDENKKIAPLAGKFANLVTQFEKLLEEFENKKKSDPIK